MLGGSPPVTESHDGPRGRNAVALTFVALALLAVVYGRTWVSFPDAWLLNRKHAFALVGFSGWLLWQGRDRLREAAPSSPLVIVPLALGSVAWALGIILDVQLVHQSLLPVLLFGWWYAVAGAGAALAALPAFAAFFLVLPYWGLFVRPLQSLTVVANGLLLRLTSLEAQISGDYIAIPAGVFEVARGCSGANYFESGVVIAGVYGLLFLRHWRARAAALALGGLLAMVSNWIRVFGLILIGQATEMQSSLIREHNTYGWVIFAATMGLFFLLTRRIEAYDARLGERSALVAPAAEGATVTRRALLLPSLALLVGPTLVSLGSKGAHGADAPATVAGIAAGVSWQSLPLPSTTTWQPAYAGADEHRVSLWRRDSIEIQVDRFIYREQRQGKEMINEENLLVPDSIRRVDATLGPLDERGRMVNATLLSLPDGQRLVWQWYRVSGVDTHSTFEGKLLGLADYFSRGEPPELVAVSTPCASEQCRLEQDALFRFVTGREPPAP